jgi:hypothetical protein
MISEGRMKMVKMTIRHERAEGVITWLSWPDRIKVWVIDDHRGNDMYVYQLSTDDHVLVSAFKAYMYNLSQYEQYRKVRVGKILNIEIDATDSGGLWYAITRNMKGGYILYDHEFRQYYEVETAKEGLSLINTNRSR